MCKYEILQKNKENKLILTKDFADSITFRHEERMRLVMQLNTF